MADRNNYEQQEYTYLISRMHLQPPQAAGVLGNMQVETGGTFAPTAYNPGEDAIGISQWEGGRRQALQQFAANHGGHETDLNIQLGFLEHEANGGYNYALRDLKGTTDPAAGAAIWDQEYEHSSGDARGQRMQNARNIYGNISGGKLKPGPTPPGLPTGTNVGGPVVDDGLGGLLTNIGTDAASTEGKIISGINSWQKAVEAIGAFFGAILWIFNLDHFMKFLLYVFGVVVVAAGLGMVTFGGGKDLGTE